MTTRCDALMIRHLAGAAGPTRRGFAARPRCRSFRPSSLRFVFITLLGGVLLATWPAVALAQLDPRVPLTLAEALRVAMARNPQLAAARDELQKAEGAVLEARAPTYPRVDLIGSYLRIQDPPSLTFLGQPIELGRSNALVADLGVSQILYSGGGAAAGIREAEQHQRGAEARYRARTQELALGIHRAFYGVLFSRRLVEIRQASVEQLAAHAADTRERLRQGAASEYEVLRADVEVANHRPLVVAAEHQLERAREQLTRLLGLDLSQPIDVVGTLEVEPWTEAETRSLARAAEDRPELDGARSSEGVAAALLHVARARQRPSISWFAHLFVTSPEYLVATDATLAVNAVAGLAVRVPLFTGFEHQAQTRQAAADLEAARDRRRDLEQQVAFEVKDAYRALREANATLAAQARVIEQAEKALEIARVRYANGLGTQLEVTDAQLALEQARVVRLEAVHAHAVARATLRRGRGESLLPPGALYGK